jgi:YYY domain-containing protein
VIIGIFTLPITFRFLSRLPSKGYAVSKPLGLLLWGYAYWMLCELGLLQNNIGSEFLALGILLIFSILALRNGKAKELWQWIRGNWKTIVLVESVFLVFFSFWAVVRAANPQIAGTEKPMELAFINSILNSPTFPPRDPWLSGYAISYYYFGYVLIAMLIRITGVVSGVGYNLTSACWFALTAIAAFGMIYDLVVFWKRGKSKSSSNHFTEAQKALGRWAGILGSFFILIVSNLEGLLEFLHSGGVFWRQAADGTWSSKFWNWLAILDLKDAPSIPFTWKPSRYLVWWRGSRVLRDLNYSNGGIEIIDEFPFFSYILSDLHPHLLAMPFALLAMAISLNLFIGGADNIWPAWKPAEWLKKWQFCLTALALGSMAFFNTWDFPIYVGLFCLVLIYLKIKHVGWSSRRIWDFIAAGLTYGITGIVLFLPFFISFRSQAGGILPSLEFMTRGVHFWIMFAPLLIPVLFWLIHQWRQRNDRRKLSRGAIFALCVVGGLWLLSTLLGGLVYFTESFAGQWSLSGNPFLANLGSRLAYAGDLFNGIHGTSDGSMILLLSLSRRLSAPLTWITLTILLVLTWGLLSSNALSQAQAHADDEIIKDEPNRAINANVFVLFLVLIGIGLTLFPEYFYLRDQFGTRMNTIFKFYFQTWMFWGIAAAYATVVLWNELKGWRGILFSIAWTVMFLGAMVYPTYSLLYQTNSFKPSVWTLDGNENFRLYQANEMAAIDWLADAPDGIVAEAVGGSYTEFARVSEQTGKQTVLGWPGHELQWRGGMTEIGSREEDIKTLYQIDAWEVAQEIIATYDIRYIYLGNQEKSAYNVNSDKFENHLVVVYQNETVKIYQVPDSLLTGNQ